ncbi:MAG: anion permease [Rhizobacter sp.]|nr:anion permease [Bacteriovorax sp.]
MDLQKEVSWPKLAATVLVGLIIYFIPAPEGLSPDAWHLFAIFFAAILGIIMKAMTMGSISIISITLVAALQLLAPGKASDSIKLALSGFNNPTIWMITLSFFISRGFIKTGLGKRIAYWFIAKLGNSTLGIAYGLTFADLCFAPATPSNTARAGGIIMPIMKSISMSMGSTPEDHASHKKVGAYLTLNSYYSNLITSGMFITATASNSMCQKFAHDLGVEISWGGWAMAALLPGLLSILLVPLILYKIYPPEIKDAKIYKAEAVKKLLELGKITRNELFMVFTFFLLLLLWIFGTTLNMDASVAALIGLSFLLISDVLTWEDVKSEKGAWDTMVWFSALVMMAEGLSKLGFIGWFSAIIKNEVSGMPWIWAFPLIILVYYYSHYLFASATAHVAAMYTAFLAVSIALGIPGKLAALMLGFCGSIFGVLTHYGHGPAPVLFGTGYVDLKDWWKLGFIFSIILLIIWMGSGALWWKILGIY